MAQQYPIWHEVSACHYRSNKSYGGRDNSGETIYIGSSSTYSYEHCKVLTTRREVLSPKFGKCWIFRTSIDGIVLKESLVRIKDKKLVQRRTKLNKLKSL